MQMYSQCNSVELCYWLVCSKVNLPDVDHCYSTRLNGSMTLPGGGMTLPGGAMTLPAAYGTLDRSKSRSLSLLDVQAQLDDSESRRTLLVEKLADAKNTIRVSTSTHDRCCAAAVVVFECQSLCL